MDLKKISEFKWDVEGVGLVFASDKLIGGIDEGAVEQVKNVAELPGIIGKALAMPDVHRGYGFPIGGVAAFDLESGVISPGGVGYDINCSVRLLRTNLKEGDLKGREKELAKSLFRCVPSGVGRGGDLKLSVKELDEVLIGGAQWAVSKGYGVEEDWRHIEDEGKLKGVPEFVSAEAKKRGMDQLGTLGAGNHFLDVLVVDDVFDAKIAKVFGLKVGQVVILIHCGSRGLGHQVATDYIEAMGKRKDGLACAPIKSELGKKYFGAMNAAANFAFANKQIITHFIREDLKYYFPDFKAEVVYDVCHNIAKVEKHDIGKKEEGIRNKEMLVMRKGATRAFGPGHEDVPEDYRDVGQPVLLPGSMGTSSFVLVGTNENTAWGSCAHGAGRVRSRVESQEGLSFNEAVLDMEKRGVYVEFGKRSGMIEESPFSYKDVDEVVRVCDSAGLGRKVVKLRPKLVVIG